MFNVSNYYEQSRELPAENSYQIGLLRLADASTLLRETTKWIMVAGLVSLALSAVFNFDPPIAFTYTAAVGIFWLFTRTCAKDLELEAQDMIKHFIELRNRRLGRLYQ